MGRDIYCPICGRKVARYDGKAENNINVKCDKCNVLVIFRPLDCSVVTKKVPLRVCASGKRFY